jgi:hypothetical protein
MKGRSSSDAQAKCNILQENSQCNFIYVLCEYSVNLFLCLCIQKRTRGKVVSILTRLRAGGSVVRIPVKAR